MEQTIRTGLAGFGVSGQVFNAPFIQADPRFTLKKCYERSTDRCRAEYAGVETVRDFDALLKPDIDLVVIALPNALHVPLAQRALEAGKHVLLEKPVAASSAEAQTLCRLAREKGVVFTANQNRRLDGDFLTVKSLLERGTLGRVTDYRCSYNRFVKGVSKKPWKAAGGLGVDILYDLGIHIIDQAYVLFGLPERLYAHQRVLRPESPGCDAFEITLYYPHDLSVVLSATETAAIPGPHYTVHGENGSFVKYGMDPQEEALRAGKRPPAEHWGEDGPASYGTLCLYENGELRESRVPTVRGDYGGLYAQLYRAITEGAEPLVKPEETVDVLRILEAAQESARSGREVSL